VRCIPGLAAGNAEFSLFSLDIEFQEDYFVTVYIITRGADFFLYVM